MKLLVVIALGAPALALSNAHANAPDDLPPPLSEADLPPPLADADVVAPYELPPPHEVRPPLPVPAPHEVRPPLPVPAPHEVRPPLPLPQPDDDTRSIERELIDSVTRRWDSLRRRLAGWGVRCRTAQVGGQRELSCRLLTSDEDTRKRAAPAKRSKSPANLCGTAEESQLFALLNEERQRRGIAPLSCSARAIQVARGHSQDMCSRRFFGHFSPEGATPGHRLSRAGIHHAAAGENVARGYSTARAAHAGWMSSPAHRATMLDPQYERVGIGLVECDSTGPYWTQVFFR